MKAGMLFPGQGARSIGTGRDFYDAFPEVRELYKAANGKLGYDITEMCFLGDRDELLRAGNAQPAVLLHSLAVLTALDARGARPSVVAGHNVGEFSALVAAGFFRPMDALVAVREREQLMSEAAAETPGTMAAVFGLGAEEVDSCVGENQRDGVVAVASYDSPMLHALSGEAGAVEKAARACRASGARRTFALDAPGGFGSPLMEPIVPRFGRFLERLHRGKLRCPWVSNATGDVEHDDDRVIVLLARQLSSPIRWAASMRRFAQLAGPNILEVGPGRTLAALMKRTVEGVEVRPLSEVDDLDGVAWR